MRNIKKSKWKRILTYNDGVFQNESDLSSLQNYWHLFYKKHKKKLKEGHWCTIGALCYPHILTHW